MEFEKRCWAQIDLDNIEHNLRVVKEHAPSSLIMAAVKADAYGHGDVVIASVLEKAGADKFAVSGFAEAMSLRRAGVTKPVLVLGYTETIRAAMLSINGITQSVYSAEYAKEISQAAVKAGVVISAHIKVDTGMSRLGFSAKDNLQKAVQEIVDVTKLEGLNLEGIFTHFSVSDSAEKADVAYTKNQYKLFNETIELLRQKGVSFEIAHCCNSAAIFAYPEMQMDLVRPGVALYGCNPSSDVKCAELKTALQIKAIISLVKEIKKGDDVSYGRKFRASEDMMVATLSVGYADGYQRALSDKGIVEINGKPAKVLGMVCMDQMIVDVTGISDVKQGDVATVFGGDIADSIDKVAEKCGTINYEILCDIGRRVPRVYTRGGEQIKVTDYLD